MAVWSVVGRTGGGKSYFGVELALKALAENRPVVTNLPINFKHDLLYAWDWEVLKASDCYNADESLKAYPVGALYIIDEIWRGMGGDTKISKIPMPLLIFFKMHRHRVDAQGRADDIFLLSQSLDDAPKTIRTLVETTILCEKPTELGLDNVSIRYYHKGAICGVKEVPSAVTFNERVILSPDVYDKYDSHMSSQAVAGSKIQEGNILKVTFWRSTKFKLMVFGVLSSTCLLIWSANRLDVDHMTGKKKDGAVSVTASGVPVVPPPPDISSQKMHIVAWFVSKKTGENFVYISDGSHPKRRINPKDCSVEYDQITCVYLGSEISFWTGVIVSQGSPSALVPTMPFQK